MGSTGGIHDPKAHTRWPGPTLDHPKPLCLSLFGQTWDLLGVGSDPPPGSCHVRGHPINTILSPCTTRTTVVGPTSQLRQTLDPLPKDNNLHKRHPEPPTRPHGVRLSKVLSVRPRVIFGYGYKPTCLFTGPPPAPYTDLPSPASASAIPSRSPNRVSSLRKIHPRSRLSPRHPRTPNVSKLRKNLLLMF